jgi:hypothetical protein
MVCSRTTQDRLEMRMDRSRSTTNRTPLFRCKKSSLRTSNSKRPKTNTMGSIFHRKSHNPSADTNRLRTDPWSATRIPTTCKSLQRSSISTTTPILCMGSRNRATSGSTIHPSWKAPSTHARRTRRDTKDRPRAS